MGTVSNNGNTRPYNPQNVPIALPGLLPGYHILAVRYSNDMVKRLDSYDDPPGFTMAIGYVNAMSRTTYFNTLSAGFIIALLFAIFGTLSAVHIFLYLYDRKVKANLYFSAFTFSMAAWFVGAYGTFLDTNVHRYLLSADLTFLAIAMAAFSISGSVNTLFSKSKTRFRIISAYCFLCLVAWLLLKKTAYPAFFLLMVVVIIELIVVCTRAMYRKLPGAKIIGIGTSYFALYVLAMAVLAITGNHKGLLGSGGSVVFLISTIIAVLSIPCSISIYLAWSFSRTNKALATQLVQIRKLSEKTRQQELEKQHMLENRQQELEHEVEVRTHEILLQKNEIQQKHNELITEKKRSDDLLLNILPEEVAEELKNKGSSEARYFDHVSVIFTDFVNFTKAGERMTPQQLVFELHTCFKAFDEICAKYEVEKIKTIGDAYMAVCGLPSAIDDHAVRTLSAAIEIQKFIAKRKLQLPDTSFNIRIGVHSGSVVAGIVGVKKFAYDIWGDTVNTAARMEQSGEPGKINISVATYELIKDKFHCIYRGQIAAKNKGQMEMYFVEGRQ
jgi:class 3 adenylate cyclase